MNRKDAHQDTKYWKDNTESNNQKKKKSSVQENNDMINN